MSQQITTTDLNYAALLVTLGAEIDAIQDCGRYAKLHITVPDSAQERARDKTQRLQRLFERCESTAELQVAYEGSMLSAISEAYYQIKRRVAKERHK